MAKYKNTKHLENELFEDIKKICVENTMVHYPDFNKEFEIYIDSGDYQMGTIISQNKRPVTYWSKKLSDTEKNIPATEQELLAIAVCLKQYKTMLFKQRLIV